MSGSRRQGLSLLVIAMTGAVAPFKVVPVARHGGLLGKLGCMGSFWVVPITRHGRLGTGADFSELFPMDLRGLGTGAVFWRFVPHDFRCTNGYLGTGESFR